MSEQQSGDTATQTAGSSNSRIITTVSTRGEKTEISFSGSTWSELKKILDQKGFDTDHMKCVESTNRHSFEHKDAVVPRENFFLFMMPVKSKSGGLSRGEIYERIKTLIEKDGERARDFFTVNGQNYTRVSSADLEALLEKYSPGTKAKASVSKAEAISDVVKSVGKSVKNGDKVETLALLQGLTTDEKIDLMVELLLGLKHGQEEVVATIKGPSPEEASAKARVDAEVAETKRLKQEKEDRDKAEREEKDRLAKEAKDLFAGMM